MNTEHNEDNPRFIAYADMLNRLADDGILHRNENAPDESSRRDILVCRLVCGRERWESWNPLHLAQELYNHEEKREGLYEFLRDEKGIVPVFDERGDFTGFEPAEQQDKGKDIG